MNKHGPFETERQARETPAVRAVYTAFDADPGPGKMRPHNLDMLTRACEAAGVELGAFDRRKIEWMATWEPETCVVLAGLVRRAFRSGQAPAVEGERIGLAVVTWPQTGGSPDIEPGTGLLFDAGDARALLNEVREDTAAAGREERHEIAEVVRMEDGNA